MWYSSSPTERLFLARRRQNELIAEGRAARRQHTDNAGAAGKRARVQGLRLHLGTVLIVIGRTIYEDEPCPDAA